MDEPPDHSPDPSPYLKLPWPLVASALAAVLLLALGAGLYANRYLRPENRVAPTVVARATAQPATATSTRPLAASPTATATLAQAKPTTLPTAAASATSAPALTVTPLAVATVDPALASQIGRAYEHYWDIWAMAFLDLDSSGLRDAMDGEHLRAVEERIDQLRKENRAVDTHVSHSYVVVSANPDQAQVADEYVSTSGYVDPVTKRPLSALAPQPDRLRVVYTLRKFDDKWKVVDSVRGD